MPVRRSEKDEATPRTLPTGLQRLLRLASLDDRFLDLLVERRAAAADAAGVPLTSGEIRVLGAAEEPQIRAMARQAAPADRDRREILRELAAATVLVLTGGTALALGCRKDDDELAPERPESRRGAYVMPDAGEGAKARGVDGKVGSDAFAPRPSAQRRSTPGPGVPAGDDDSADPPELFRGAYVMPGGWVADGKVRGQYKVEEPAKNDGSDSEGQ